jgi:amyloid beta precursor protein binding protein 1
MVGSIRIQVPEHVVVETHPEHPLPDLRLDRPFSALSNLADATRLETMELKDHAHVPYVILLYKALREYESRHPGCHPTTRAEKNEFRVILRSG